MAVSRTGDWARARRLLTAAPQRLQAAIGTAVRQEAHALRNEIVQGLTRQAPGGEPLKPPSPLTIAARELEGFGGTKALIVRDRDAPASPRGQPRPTERHWQRA